MKNPIQNQDCKYEAGTLSCLRATWSPVDKREYNPCQHCPWWDEFCAEEDDD